MDKRDVIKGRGASSNAAGRYERYGSVSMDDGWDLYDDDPLPPLETILTEDLSRSIITRNTSPDIPFDRSINPYRGCEHGCIYCFARPSHAWLGLSPGLDFETRLTYKPQAATLLADELRAPRYRCAPIALGTNTDPYQPVERKLGIVRRILETLRDFQHPVSITTKSALILRDLDILAPMAAQKLASVAISVTTLDRHLARILEPRAATPSRRLETIKGLAAAGIPTAVLVAPLIPALNDHEMETILAAAQEAGALMAGKVFLRLPLEVEALFTEWLETHMPDRAGHIMSLVRQSRGGRAYQSAWGVRMKGEGPYAELLAQRFKLAIKRYGLDQASSRFKLDTTRFRPAPQSGDQFSLFDPDAP